MKLHLNKDDDNAYVVRVVFDTDNYKEVMLLLTKSSEDAKTLMDMIVDSYDDFYEVDKEIREKYDGVIDYVLEMLRTTDIEFIYCDVYDAILY